jgi:hypothetical protein
MARLLALSITMSRAYGMPFIFMAWLKLSAFLTCLTLDVSQILILLHLFLILQTEWFFCNASSITMHWPCLKFYSGFHFPSGTSSYLIFHPVL